MPDQNRQQLNRRRFAKRVLGSGLLISGAGLGYSWLEAGWLRIHRESIRVPHLPAPFRGLKVAFLSDIHHGPYTSLDYVRTVIDSTNNLSPDLVLLGGDYVHRDARYILPCFQEHAALRAPLGVYGILGNHDHWEGAEATKLAMQKHGVVELTNRGKWIEKDGARLRLSGVGDLWEDRQDLETALGDARDNDAAIVLSHNPDFVEGITDCRVGLVLSGHTHGGQVVLPAYGAPLVPSRYGQKYLHGLVETKTTQVFVSRGLGTVTPPLRFCCRPEIVLLRLA